jgi:hypothetical protein
VTWVWAVGALALFGIATPILFGIAGTQTRKRSWLVAAVLYGVLSWGGCTLAIAAPDDSDVSTVGGLMILIAWIGGAVHAFVARPEYAKRLRGPATPLERARNAVERRREAQRLARDEPQAALEMGLGRPDVPGAAHMGVVDANHASADALTRLPGVSDALAHEIVRSREEIDGFGSLEDMGGVLGLDADLVEDLRPYVVFLPH